MIIIARPKKITQEVTPIVKPKAPPSPKVTTPPIVNHKVPTPQLKVKCLTKTAAIPFKGTEQSAGLDLFCDADVLLLPQSNAVLIPTGIAIELPKGYHAKIFLRSSTGARTKIRLANGTGIVDEDYRGQIMLLAENVGNTPVRVFAGERIAQMLIEKTEQIKIVQVSELSDTSRGEGGFGSTKGGK